MTPLIIRNLHLGCESFGEILEGAPEALVVFHTRQSLVPELIEPAIRIGFVKPSTTRWPWRLRTG